MNNDCVDSGRKRKTDWNVRREGLNCSESVKLYPPDKSPSKTFARAKTSHFLLNVDLSGDCAIHPSRNRDLVFRNKGRFC